MLMLCAPAETEMDAVKFVEVSLPAEGNEMLVCKAAVEKNFQAGTGRGDLSVPGRKKFRSADN